MGYRSDIQNLMSQMDFIVLSSLWEGLPLTPIEAFSVGKTIVATAVDGTIEIVENEKNGLLVNARDSKELAKYINNILDSLNDEDDITKPKIKQNKKKKKKESIDDEKDRIKYEKNAVITYNKKFSFEILRKNYLDYYKKSI